MRAASAHRAGYVGPAPPPPHLRLRTRSSADDGSGGEGSPVHGDDCARTALARVVKVGRGPVGSPCNKSKTNAGVPTHRLRHPHSNLTHHRSPVRHEVSITPGPSQYCSRLRGTHASLVTPCSGGGAVGRRGNKGETNPPLRASHRGGEVDHRCTGRPRDATTTNLFIGQTSYPSIDHHHRAVHPLPRVLPAHRI